MQTYEQAKARIVHNPNLTRSQREDRMDDLRRRAARGEVKLDPCARCEDKDFIYDDGCLLCSNCGLDYGTDPDDD